MGACCTTIPKENSNNTDIDYGLTPADDNVVTSHINDNLPITQNESKHIYTQDCRITSNDDAIDNFVTNAHLPQSKQDESKQNGVNNKKRNKFNFFKKKSKHKNSNDMEDDMEEVMYAVGNNDGSFEYINDAINPDILSPVFRTKYIYNGDSFRIYATQNHDEIHYLPNQQQDKFSPIDFRWSATKSSIRKVFCNVNGKCAFFIAEDNKVYGYGPNQWAALGLGHSQPIDPMHSIGYRSWRNGGVDTKITPVHIPFFETEVSNVIDIQTAASNYSFALCSRADEKTHILVELWARLRGVYCPPEIVRLIINFYNSHYNLYSVGFTLMGSSAYWAPIWALTSVNIEKIATGFDHSVFLEPSGIVWCVGDNKFGQLGLGHLNMVTIPTKIKFFVKNQILIKDIKCGQNHCLALDVNGNVYGWGHNGAGQCGDGTTYHIKRPKLISLFYDNKIEIVEIGTGAYHSFSKSSDDKYYLFGGNKYNECVIYDNAQYIVLIPQCINQIVKEKCGGRQIKSIHLGQSNTMLILAPSLQQKQMATVQQQTSNGGILP